MVEEATSKQEVSSSSPIRNWRLIVQVEALIFCKINAKFNAKICKIYAKFNAKYVRSAATSADSSENSPPFSYMILRWMRWIFVFKFNAFNAKLCKKIAVIFPICQR